MSDFLDWFRKLFNPTPPKPPTPTPPTPTPPKPPTPPTPTPIYIIDELLAAHNKERTKIGVDILTINNNLISAAQKHAQWMSDNEILAHKGAYGFNSFDRISQEGYKSRAAGENIARGYSNTQSVIQGWMSSPGHRNNILSIDFKQCGFAKVGRYWCAVFATPTNNQSFQLIIKESGPLFESS